MPGFNAAMAWSWQLESCKVAGAAAGQSCSAIAASSAVTGLHNVLNAVLHAHQAPGEALDL